MVRQRLKLFYQIVLLLVLTSCFKDDQDRDFIIEPEFQEYVDRFFHEAELRGISISNNNLEVRFVDQIEGGFCGYGYSRFGSVGNARVEIVNDENCWQARTDLEKENLIFHELGHALLSRPHLATRFDNGYPASLMCSSQTERGIQGCNNFQIYYQMEEMRSYYMDELLFGLDNTSEPSWISSNEFTNTLFVDSIGSDISSWTVFGDTSLFDHFLDSSKFTNSKSLAIALSVSTDDEVSGGWLHRFDIQDFEDCSTLKARAKVKTTSAFDGTIRLGTSLRERAQSGELYRFMYHEIRKNALDFNDNEWIEVEIYCVPERSEVVTISFSLIGNSPDTVYIDDVAVELWN